MWREASMALARDKSQPTKTLIFYIMGTKRFRRSVEDYFVQDCVSVTVKTFNFLTANDNVDFDYALAA